METLNFMLSFLRPLLYYLNGTPKGLFQASWGLWQGDPLSPFLFTLPVDSQPNFLITAKSKGLFLRFQVGSHKVKVSHLQFVGYYYSCGRGPKQCQRSKTAHLVF